MYFVITNGMLNFNLTCVNIEQFGINSMDPN